MREVNVTRAETRVFACNRRSFPGGVWHIVSQISASHGCKILTLRSVLQVSYRSKDVYSVRIALTGLSLVPEFIVHHRNSLIGHITRLTEDAMAHQALWYHIDMTQSSP